MKKCKVQKTFSSKISFFLFKQLISINFIRKRSNKKHKHIRRSRIQFLHFHFPFPFFFFFSSNNYINMLQIVGRRVNITFITFVNRLAILFYFFQFKMVFSYSIYIYKRFGSLFKIICPFFLYNVEKQKATKLPS